MIEMPGIVPGRGARDPESGKDVRTRLELLKESPAPCYYWY
jgi:hypothetical protein